MSTLSERRRRKFFHIRDSISHSIYYYIVLSRYGKEEVERGRVDGRKHILSPIRLSNIFA